MNDFGVWKPIEKGWHMVDMGWCFLTSNRLTAGAKGQGQAQQSLLRSVRFQQPPKELFSVNIFTEQTPENISVDTIDVINHFLSTLIGRNIAYLCKLMPKAWSGPQPEKADTPQIMRFAVANRDIFGAIQDAPHQSCSCPGQPHNKNITRLRHFLPPDKGYG